MELKLLKLNKKGQGISFNWIFSMIVGVLIFIFLVYFAVQNTDLFGKVTAKVVSEELDVLFSGVETSKTLSSLDFDKKVDLRFSCNSGDQRLSVNGKGGTNLWGKNIFAPNIIEANEIKIATEAWEIPFRVGNFIYVWDEGYNFEGIKPDLDILEDLEGSGERIVFQEDNGVEDFSCDFAGSSNNPNIKTIYHQKNENLDDYQGYVCFEGEDSNPVRFYGKAMMIGAILSKDKDNFECVKEGIEERMNVMNIIYEEKTKIMIASEKDGEKCNPQISNLGYDDVGYVSDINGLDSDAVKKFESVNNNLIRGGCAGIY